jgi:replicative DNA helicase
MPTKTNTVKEQVNIPPFSQEAEQAVLGGLMIDPEAWDNISDKITKDEFYQKEHQLIYQAAYDLSSKNLPIDIIHLKNQLSSKKQLKNAGGSLYLANLSNQTEGTSAIEFYANIIREKSILRKLITVGNEIKSLSLNSDGKDARDILDEAESMIFKIAENIAGHANSTLNISEVITNTSELLQELYENQRDITGIATGFIDFDKMTSGLQSSDLIVLAARPSMGKTTLAMNFIENTIFKEKKSVLFFSMEMSAEQIGMRLISSLGKITVTDLRTGNIKDQDWKQITAAMSQIHASPYLYIDDSSSLTPMDVRTRARRLKRKLKNTEHPLSMIVIDYMSLMRVPNILNNKVAEMSEISRSLKALAKELDVPLVALSQLNRASENRSDHRPILSDLRESGSIEQDADVIAFIYRDVVYNEEIKGTKKENISELIVRKQRNGAVGTVNLMFSGKFSRFDNFAPDVTYDTEEINDIPQP